MHKGTILFNIFLTSFWTTVRLFWCCFQLFFVLFCFALFCFSSICLVFCFLFRFCFVFPSVLFCSVLFCSLLFSSLLFSSLLISSLVLFWSFWFGLVVKANFKTSSIQNVTIHIFQIGLLVTSSSTLRKKLRQLLLGQIFALNTIGTP